MIRTILGFAVAVIFLVIGIFVLLVETIRAKRNKEASDLRCLRMVQRAFRVICGICRVKLEVRGEEHVPKDEAVFYVANHCSWFDILLTYSRVPNLTGYVAKDDIERVPLLSNWMRRLHCLFMSRTDMRAALKTILAGVEELKNGVSVFIFPEGTRNKNPREKVIGEFKDGAFKMATKAGCKVVPVAISNTRDIFENHLPFVKTAHVIIEYLEPVDIAALEAEDKKHPGRYFQAVIAERLIDHREMGNNK